MTCARVVAAILACTLAACGGAETGSSLMPVHPGVVALGSVRALRHTTVRLRVRGARRAGHPRGARYLSPSMQSLVYVITGPAPASTVVGGGAVDLTVGSKYCSSPGALQPLTCTTEVPVTISGSGSYTFNVGTYDAKQGCGGAGICSHTPCTPGASGGAACTGNALSVQKLAQTLTVGKTNTVSLALGGVAASVTVTPVKVGYLSGDVLGLTLSGKASQQIAVVPRDADGNAIVGPGSPTIGATIANTATMTVSPAHTTGSGIFTLSLVAAGNTSLSIQLTAPSGGGGVPAPNPTVVPVYYQPVVLVAGKDCVTNGPASAVLGQNDCGILFGSSPVPGAIATSADQIQYAGVEGFAVYPSLPGVLVSPNIGPISFAVSALTGPKGIAVDRMRMLYIANDDASGDSIVVVPAYGGTSGAISGAHTGLNAPAGVALDAFDTMYVTNTGTNSITEYAYGSLGDAVPSVTLSGNATGLSNPQGIAIDANGTVYVANESANTVTEYAATANGNAAPIATITGLNQPTGIAVDVGGTIYVANAGSHSIAEYAAGAAGDATPIANVTGFGTPSTGALTSVSVAPAAVQP